MKFSPIPFLLLLYILVIAACEQPQGSTPIASPTPTEEGIKLASGKQAKVEGKISLDRNYYMVFDGSGSMGEGDCRGNERDNISAAKWATKQFVTTILPQDTGLGLFVFDRNGTNERVPIGKDNRAMILKSIDDIRADGGTPLNDSIKGGVDALRIQREKQLRYGTFTLLVITDGEAQTQDGVNYAKEYKIPIVTIGFCLEAKHPLAAESISYRNALDPSGLLVALQEVLAESDSFSSAK